MPSLMDSLYSSSPTWLQNAGIWAYGIVWKRRRFGGIFERELSGFLDRERFSAAEWKQWQTKRLRALLVHCYDEVPAYRDKWQAAGITRVDLGAFELEHLVRLPLTEKEELRRDPGAFLARRRTRGLHSYLTSGTTGTPLAVRMSAATHQTWSAAYEARVRHWAGVTRHMSRAMLGGRLVVPHARSEPPFWRYNPAERQLYLSAFHISPGNVASYADALNRYRPEYLVGYASAHFFLARLIREAGIDVHSPRAVLTSSEKLTDEMRAIISDVYRCPVFDAYSGVEPCCLASECEARSLHVNPDVGIAELLKADGTPAMAGEEGEIVATGLLNFDQPLVRYRMGDFAAWSPEACSCGRAMPVLRELVGRLEDTVIGADGRELVRFHGIFLDLTGVIEGQIVQEALDRFTVRLVAPQGVTSLDRARIVERFNRRLGAVQVDIDVVDRIERTQRGKFRAVVSKVPRSVHRTTI